MTAFCPSTRATRRAVAVATFAIAALVACSASHPTPSVGGAGGAGGATQSDAGKTGGQAGAGARACTTASDCPPGPEWVCAFSPGLGSTCQCSPSGAEVCDGRDNDCNGSVDDGAKCPGVEVCSAGKCSCPAKNQCGSDCVDVTRDPAHCGSCGTACPQGATCQAGVCSCGSGRTVCGAACVDLTSDHEHCGDCATRCTALEICVSGRPACAHTLCGTSCVDLDEDPANCGRCGHDCLGGGCIDGACQPVQIVSDDTVAGFAIDGDKLYYNSLSHKEVRRAALDGTSVTTLATGQDFSETNAPLGIHPSGWIYWGGQFTGLMRLPLDLSSGPTGVSFVNTSSFAFDTTHVYFAGYDADVDALVVNRSDLDGGNLITLNLGYTPIGDLAVVGSTLDFALPGGPWGPSFIEQVGIDGSGLRVIATWPTLSCCTPAGALTTDNGSLLWSGFDVGPSASALIRADLDGSHPAALTIAAATQIMVDASTIYFIADDAVGDFANVGLRNYYQAGVYRLSPGAGAAEQLVALNWVVHIEQDAPSVFYSVASGSAQGIWRLAK